MAQLISAHHATALEVNAPDVDAARTDARRLTLAERGILQGRVIVGTYFANEIRLKRHLMQFAQVRETRSDETLTLGVGAALAEAMVGLHVLQNSREVADRMILKRLDRFYSRIQFQNTVVNYHWDTARIVKKQYERGQVPGVRLLDASKKLIEARLELGKSFRALPVARISAIKLRLATAGILRNVGFGLGGALIFDAGRSLLTIAIEPDKAAAAEQAWSKYAADAEAALRDRV